MCTEKIVLKEVHGSKCLLQETNTISNKKKKTLFLQLKEIEKKNSIKPKLVKENKSNKGQNRNEE